MKNLQCLTLLLGLGFSLFAQTNIWYVNAAAGGSDNGQSWINAFKDLHLALQAAQSGDAIWVAAGTYYPDTGYHRDRSFVLKSGVKIYGGFNGTESMLNQRDLQANPVKLSGNIGNPTDSTDNSYTILYMAYPDTSTRIDGFIFQHGYARNDTNFYTDVPTSSGGAVYIMAQNGKALPVFANCIFRDNIARFNGGAIYVQGQGTQGSTPIFKNCTFVNNKARVGGCIYLKGGNAFDRGIEFDHCSFIGNYADTQGGCVYVYNTFGNEKIDFLGCIISYNNCMSLGSFFRCLKIGTNPATIKIDSCIISENQPNSSAIFYLDGLGQVFKTKLEVIRCAIFDNRLSHPFGVTSTIIGIGNEPTSTIQDSIIIIQNTINNNVSLSDIAWYYNSNTYAQIENNFCFNTAGLAAAGGNIVFSNNKMLAGAVGGVRFISSSNSSCSVNNNIFANNSCLNLDIDNAENIAGGTLLNLDSIKIINNLFFKNNVAISHYWGLNDSIKQTNIISNNIFNENKKIIELYNSQLGELGKNYAYFSHNLLDQQCDTFSARVICGPGNILSNDPQFVDTSAFNFHLLPCSPAINQGDNALLGLLGILQDIEQNPRIVESTVDIGAYESPAFALATTPAILPACTGTPGGAITISPTNGCEPYTYQWLPSAGNGPEITDLPPGDYIYTVTDARGRKLSDTLSITTAQPPVLAPLTQNIQCGSPIGGSATVSVSNGSAPYSFLWENAATDSLRTMLPAGDYQVTVTDHNGCRDSTQMTITKQGNITLMVDGEAISCFGAADAMISAAPVNGKAPFQYLWSPTGSSDSLLTDLGPGMYTVTATDFYGCTATFTFTLSDPGLLQASILTMPASSIQSPNGIATANVSGGTAPHTYAWSNSGSTMTIGGLPPAIYTVTVTDANGCSTTATAQVKLVSSSTEIADLTVQVWPNPMRERLELQAPGLPAGAYRFVLRDALGRVVAGVDVLGERAVLDVRDLAAGAYSWSLEGKNGVLARGKVVK